MCTSCDEDPRVWILRRLYTDIYEICPSKSMNDI